VVAPRRLTVAAPVIHCRVEIPKGSRNKYEWDEDLQAIRFDRFLFSSVVYPLDYGFIPYTLAEDGDPLDAMVAVSEPTFPGCMIPVNPIALFKMRDEKGVDDKVICVPFSDPNWNGVHSLEEFPPQLRDEVTHFFDVYKTLEPGKDVAVEGWFDRDEALAVIEDSSARWQRQRGHGATPPPTDPAISA
jgi:inorganic pyrophosphatase